MLILPLQIYDIPNVKPLQPADWPDFTPFLTFYVNSPHCFPLKIVEHDEIVGIGTTILHENTAWLAHIIVHPEHRNKGIGKLITTTLIESINHNKYKTISLLATTLGEPVYTSLGFKIVTEYMFFKGEKVANLFHENIKPLAEKQIHSVLMLDKIVSGEDRKWQLLPHLNSAYSYTFKNALLGYYLPDLGEGLIIAKDETAGKELMKFRFLANEKAVCPITNKAALATIEAGNFNYVRSAKRMFLGKEIDFKSKYVFNRVSGQIG